MFIFEVLTKPCRMKSLICSIIFCFIVTSPFTQTNGIEVVFKSGNTVYTNHVHLTNNHLWIGRKKGRKISINEVVHIKGTDQKQKDRYIVPVQMLGQKVWGERFFESDRIEIFYTDVLTDSWNSTFKGKYFLYSKDGGTPKKLKASNLKYDLRDNLESLRLIKKGQGFFAGQMLLYGIGATLLGMGIASDMSKDLSDPPTSNAFEIPPVYIAGVAVLYSPWLLNGPRQNSYLNALRVYE